MGPDEPPDDDPSPSGPPLPPEDRLWRHPSELGAFGAGGSPDQPRSDDDRPLPPQPRAEGRRRGTLAATALASCLVGAFVALVGVALLDTDDDSTGGSADTASSAPTSVSLRTGSAAAAADDLAPSVARIVVRVGDRWLSGAGTLVDDKGSVVTTASLVVGASQLQVTFVDGRSRKAKVVGTDDATGLAVIDVDAEGVQPARLASAGPEVAEQVTLVSGPADDGRVARTAMGRVHTVDTQVHTTTGTVEDLVGIDVEVLPHDCGSAVADSQGRLAGVSIGGDPNDGRGEIVPADVVGDVTTALVSDDGGGSRAWLGVEAVDLDVDRAESLGVDGGARLTKVEEDSPADQAGLTVEDVVVAIDGDPVGSTADIVADLRDRAPREQVTVQVHRDGSSVEVTATLGTKPQG